MISLASSDWLPLTPSWRLVCRPVALVGYSGAATMNPAAASGTISDRYVSGTPPQPWLNSTSGNRPAAIGASAVTEPALPDAAGYQIRVINVRPARVKV